MHDSEYTKSSILQSYEIVIDELYKTRWKKNYQC